MTEAGKTWVNEHQPPGSNFPGLHTEEAEHWLRAVFTEVERRANKWITPGESQDPAGPVFNALNELKRELLDELYG